MRIFFFFFSSRRRHTRSLRDWSSDVCSSDLFAHGGLRDVDGDEALEVHRVDQQPRLGRIAGTELDELRSEERRVGKECITRRMAFQCKKLQKFRMRLCKSIY